MNPNIVRSAMGGTETPKVPLDVVSGRMMTGGLGYYVRLEGSGPPVLLLHGFTGNHQSWETVTQHLRDNYTVIRPDLPGHGASVVGKTQSWSMDTVAFSLLRLMRELGFPNFSCVGYSMGGRVALSIAEKAPHRLDALVVESGSPGLRTTVEREKRTADDNALAENMESIGLQAFVEEWSQKPLFMTEQQLPPEMKSQQRNIRLSHLVSGLAASLRNMGTGVQASVWDDLEHIDVPTLLISGELDNKFSAIGRSMQSLMPHAEHVVVRGAGHDVHLERPDTYIEILQSFLKRHAKRVPDSQSWIRTTMFSSDGED